MTVDQLGPWYGGLQLRILGSYPLNPDSVVRGQAYSELDSNFGYILRQLTKIQGSINNGLDQKADAFD